MNGMRDTNSFYNYQRDNNRHDDSNRNRDNINVVIVKQQIEVVTQVVNEGELLSCEGRRWCVEADDLDRSHHQQRQQDV